MWSLLKRVHHDRRGAVSVETVLIIAAIALPILIFLGRYAWPRVKGIFIDGLDDLEGAKTALKRALEIDPAYVDTAIRRWQAGTGGSARLAGSDQTFDDIVQASDRHANGRSDDKPLPPVDLTASTREAAYV